MIKKNDTLPSQKYKKIPQNSRSDIGEREEKIRKHCIQERKERRNTKEVEEKEHGRREKEGEKKKYIEVKEKHVDC